MNDELDELRLAHAMLEADYADLAREKDAVLERLDQVQIPVSKGREYVQHAVDAYKAGHEPSMAEALDTYLCELRTHGLEDYPHWPLTDDLIGAATAAFLAEAARIGWVQAEPETWCRVAPRPARIEVEATVDGGDDGGWRVTHPGDSEQTHWSVYEREAGEDGLASWLADFDVADEAAAKAYATAFARALDIEVRFPRS